MLAQIYDNAEFVVGCVDDLAPVGPSLHAMGHGGTCIILDPVFISKMRVLPETNERLNVDQLMQDECSFCHANVYHPSRGSTDDGMRFTECLDMLLETVVKYRGSHIVVIGGDFNDSLHRRSGLRKGRILAEFVTNHPLNSDVTSPIGDTFFHASNE